MEDGHLATPSGLGARRRAALERRANGEGGEGEGGILPPNPLPLRQLGGQGNSWAAPAANGKRGGLASMGGGREDNKRSEGRLKATPRFLFFPPHVPSGGVSSHEGPLRFPSGGRRGWSARSARWVPIPPASKASSQPSPQKNRRATVPRPRFARDTRLRGRQNGHFWGFFLGALPFGEHVGGGALVKKKKTRGEGEMADTRDRRMSFQAPRKERDACLCYLT